MLILLIIVAVAVVVLFCTGTERGRTVAFCTGVLCLALGARSVALLSDSYSSAFVSSVHAQETSIAQDSTEGVLEAEPVAAEVTSDADLVVPEQPEGAATEPVVSESTGDDPSDDLVIGVVTDVEYLTERPDWIETRPTLEGDVHRLPVESGLYSHVQAADEALLEQLHEQVTEYIDDHVGKSYAAKLVGYDIQRVGNDSDPKFQLTIDGQVFDVTDTVFREQVRVSVGVMHQTHVLVKIDQACRDQLDHRWSEIVATCRLLQTGLGAGVVLLLLGTVFSYFRLDTATRGYYTGRLQFGAAAAILALIAASVVLGKWIPWL
jgi:hypothetical protein